MSRWPVILSFWCAAAGAQHPDAVRLMNECSETTQQMRLRGDITRLERSKMLRECSDRYNGPSPIYNEFWTYHAYISAELDAGRMTQQKAEYLLTVKQHELEARVSPSRPAIILAPQPTPRYIRPAPRGPVITNCNTDPWGNTTCYTH